MHNQPIRDEHVKSLDGNVFRLDDSLTHIPDRLIQATVGDKTFIGDKHRQIRQRCEKMSPSLHQGQLHRFPLPPLISTNHTPKILFCPMAKVGSTFFTRYFMNLNKPGPMKSPYSIKIEDAKQSGLENLNIFKHRRQRIDFLDTAFKFVFCRNPYWRLFSAFIDKLYSPNPYYWKSWGNFSKEYKRQKCGGAGMSFPSFVDTVVLFLSRKDIHFLPMSVLCKLCDVNWDFVGTMEDAVHDIDSLSHLLNVTASFQHEPGYRQLSALEAISDATREVFMSWKTDVTKCMTMYDAGRIIWRKLQIRGVIYSNMNFPFQEEEMESMDLNTFQQACIHATERSTNANKLKAQKLSAFTEAYRMLNKHQLDALRRVYYRDIILLQYPERPLATDDNVSINASHILNWREPWIT